MDLRDVRPDVLRPALPLLRLTRGDLMIAILAMVWITCYLGMVALAAWKMSPGPRVSLIAIAMLVTTYASAWAVWYR